jgi:hypothetical protein
VNSNKPIFLVVICSLSAFFISLSLFSSLLNSFVSNNETQRQFIETKEQVISLYHRFGMEEDLINSLDEYLTAKGENMGFEKFSNLIFILLEGLAVYLMYNLKKNGFTIYVVVQFLFLGELWLLYPMENPIALGQFLMTLGISALFVFLYALNLKSMKS